MKKMVAIIGGGESGVGAALLAKQQGYDILVSDYGKIKEKYKKILIQNQIPFEEKGHDFERLKRAFLVIKSPGVPGEASIIMQLTRHQLPVISEIEFASQLYYGTIIGITGSNGKTTTSGLIFHLLSHAGLDVGLSGNIGNSFAAEIALKPPKKIMVLEISNFQLDDIDTFSPDIAVLLNITPDHLDRYNYEFDRYINAKFQIINKQSENDIFIYNADDSSIVDGLPKYLNNQRFEPISLEMYKNGVLNNDSNKPFKTLLLGQHNAFNTMVAVKIARHMNLTEQQIADGLATFKPVEHRLECVRTIENTDYINDSKATNIDAVYYALQAIDKPIVWIVGGVDKGNDYTIIEDIVVKNVKAIICLGIDNSKLLAAFSPHIKVIEEAESMKLAVQLASTYTEGHDVVLLSPACASFDLFDNYEDRGRQFKEEVGELLSE